MKLFDDIHNIHQTDHDHAKKLAKTHTNIVEYT